MNIKQEKLGQFKICQSLYKTLVNKYKKYFYEQSYFHNIEYLDQMFDQSINTLNNLSGYVVLKLFDSECKKDNELLDRLSLLTSLPCFGINICGNNKYDLFIYFHDEGDTEYEFKIISIPNFKILDHYLSYFYKDR